MAVFVDNQPATVVYPSINHVKVRFNDGTEKLVSYHQVKLVQNYPEAVTNIAAQINGYTYDVSDEKQVQKQIFDILNPHFYVVREYKLSAKSICDFMINDSIAVEVKVKGSKTDIFRQLKRYCEFDQVKCLVFITAKSMGLPEFINNKPVYYISLTKNML